MFIDGLKITTRFPVTTCLVPRWVARERGAHFDGDASEETARDSACMEVYAARRPDHSNCDVGNSMSTMCVGSGRIGEDGNGEEDGKFGYAPDKKTKHKKVEQNRRLLTKERETPTLNPKP